MNRPGLVEIPQRTHIPEDVDGEVSSSDQDMEIEDEGTSEVSYHMQQFRESSGRSPLKTTSSKSFLNPS